MNATDATLTPLELGYAVTLNGETLGTVYRSGRTWRYTLSDDATDRALAARTWLTRRDLANCLGGYTRADATQSLLDEVSRYTR